MAVPNATATVVGGPITITDAVRQDDVVITDTGSYSPAATGRSVKVHGDVVDTGVGTVSGLRFASAGTYPVAINVVNADGNDDSVAVNVVVTDALVASPPATYTPTGGSPRYLRKDMPREFGDGTVETAGVPTVGKANAARLLGAAGLLVANHGIVVTDAGEAQLISLA